MLWLAHWLFGGLDVVRNELSQRGAHALVSRPRSPTEGNGLEFIRTSRLSIPHSAATSIAPSKPSKPWRYLVASWAPPHLHKPRLSPSKTKASEDSETGNPRMHPKKSCNIGIALAPATSCITQAHLNTSTPRPMRTPDSAHTRVSRSPRLRPQVKSRALS